jgi:hypothetical protein
MVSRKEAGFLTLHEMKERFVQKCKRKGMDRQQILDAYNRQFGTHYDLGHGLLPRYLRDLPVYRHWCFDPVFLSNPGIALDDRNRRMPRCTICHGKFPFASENAWGIKPDRTNPHLFICWECVHWLFKVFLDHITNFSYMFVFSDQKIKIGKYSSRVMRDEKVLP